MTDKPITATETKLWEEEWLKQVNKDFNEKIEPCTNELLRPLLDRMKIILNDGGIRRAS